MTKKTTEQRKEEEMKETQVEQTEPVPEQSLENKSEVDVGRADGENLYPPESLVAFQAEVNEYASDGGLLVTRHYTGDKTHCLDIWKTKRGKFQVVRTTSDIKGTIMQSFPSEEEAKTHWKNEISKLSLPKEGKSKTRVEKSTPEWAIVHTNDGGMAMTTPTGLKTGTRDELMAIRRDWHAEQGVSLEETLAAIVKTQQKES